MNKYWSSAKINSAKSSTLSPNPEEMTSFVTYNHEDDSDEEEMGHGGCRIIIEIMNDFKFVTI